MLGSRIARADHVECPCVTRITVLPIDEKLIFHAHNHWIGISLVGTKSNRDGFGSKVAVRVGGAVRHYQAISGGSYMTASDKRLLIGLGQSDRVESIEVRWPSGVIDHLHHSAVNRYVTVTEGERN